MKTEHITTVYSNPSDSGLIAAAALLKNGLNINDENDKGFMKNGSAVAKTIHDLAKETGAIISEQLEARAKTFDDIKGMTDRSIDQINEWSRAIAEKDKYNKQMLENVRSFRMTLTSELAMIETSIKKIQSLGTQKLVADLEAIGKALANPYIQKLLKGDSDGNQG